MRARRPFLLLTLLGAALLSGPGPVRAEDAAGNALRWAADPALAYPTRHLTFAAAVPAKVQAPQSEAGPLLFAEGPVVGGRRWLLALEPRATGRLWFDADFDGDLGEETPEMVVLPERGRARVGLSFVHPEETSAGAPPLDLELVLEHTAQETTARLRVRAHREGEVVVAGRLRPVQLFDANVDLRFDEVGVDQLALDVDGDGGLSLWEGALDRVDLQTPFRIGSGAYDARVLDAAGARLDIAPTPAEIAARVPMWRPAPMPPSGETAALVPGAFEAARDAYEAWMARPHPHRLIPELERLIRAIGKSGARKAFAYLQKMLVAWEEIGSARENLSVRVAIVQAMGNGHYADQEARLTKLARTAEEKPVLLAGLAALHAAGAPKREKFYAALLKTAEDPQVIAALETLLGYLQSPSARKLLAKRLKKEAEPARITGLYRALYRYAAVPPSRDDILAAAADKRERMRALGIREALDRRLPEARALALGAAARRSEDPELQAAVVEVLGRAGDAEAARAVLQVAAQADAGLRQRIVALLSAVRDVEAAKAIGTALDASADPVRAVAAESLAGIGEGKTEPILVARLGVERAPVVLVALIRALGVLRSDAAVPGILAAVTRGSDTEDLLEAATLALARIPSTAPEVRAFFETHLQKRAWDARIATLDALAEQAHPLAASLLIASLQADDRRVRAAAAQGLGRVRVREAVEPLMAALEKEEDARVRHAVAQALFLTTGQYLYDDLPTWKRWWAEQGATFVVPVEVPELPEAKDAETYGATFYGVPVASEQIVFVLDQSGSMGAMQMRADAKPEDNRGWTELERAVAETLQVVDTLSEKAHVNVVCFETSVNPWKAEPVTLTKGARKELRRWLESLEPGSSTNLWGGLELALGMRDVEEIYLLSDGQPGAGRYRRTADILREVRALNRKRRIAIHCISLGVDSPLLKQLAAENNGIYTRR
jgi:HEAT repeat protein